MVMRLHCLLHHNIIIINKFDSWTIVLMANVNSVSLHSDLAHVFAKIPENPTGQNIFIEDDNNDDDDDDNVLSNHAYVFTVHRNRYAIVISEIGITLCTS